MRRDLAGLTALVDNRQYRTLKAATPGRYTFILKATREVRKRLRHPGKKIIGLGLPDHKVARALLSELGEPLLSSTLLLPGDELPLNDPDEIRDRLEHQVDLILGCGSCGIVPMTILALTGRAPVVRRGRGSIRPFGLE